MSEENLCDELPERLRFEKLLNEISARFVNLTADGIDTEIEDARRRVCECLGLDLSALWQWPDDIPHWMTVTHMHKPPGRSGAPGGNRCPGEFFTR